MRVLIIILSVFLAIATVGFIGFSANLSKNYHVEAEAVYDRPSAMVWDVMTNYETMPTWSPTIAKTESLGMKDGKPAWHLELKDGHFMDVRVEESIKEKLFKSTIIDTNTPYEGTWIIAIEAISDKKTAVKLTEEGKIKSPFWRFIIHYFVGQDAMIKQTLTSTGEELAKRPVVAVQPAASITAPTVPQAPASAVTTPTIQP
jgi:uncharacterized protein YndB with AHSA1/START domain